MGSTNGASRRRIETEDKEQYRDDCQDHQNEVDGRDHKFVGFSLFPAHLAKSLDKTADQTDGCHPRLQGGHQEEHREIFITPGR